MNTKRPLILGLVCVMLIGGCGLFQQPRVTNAMRDACPGSDDALLESMVIILEAGRDGISKNDAIAGIVNGCITSTESVEDQVLAAEVIVVCTACAIVMVDHVYGP